MSVLTIFDQTVPYVSGYSMRSNYITESLHHLDLDLKVVRSPIFSYKKKEEKIKGVEYFSSTVLSETFGKVPVLKQFAIVDAIKDTLSECLSDDVQLIHAHSSVLNGMAALKIARQRKIPFVYEVRALWEDAAVDQGKTKEGGLRYNLTRALETRILKKADHIFVICEGLQEEIKSRGIALEKITVIPNGVDTDKFNPVIKSSAIVKKHDLKNSQVIGFIGTFFEFEGLDVLIKAVPEILERKKDVKFLLVGGGRQEDELKKLVKDMGLKKHVIFTGRVKHDEVQKYYSVMDVLVYPRKSKRITELVTPLKPLEAMALKKAVLASDVGGLIELVTDEFNGLLFKAGNSEHLAEQCLRLLNNPQLVEDLGAQGRRFVIQERNWQRICQRYISVYRELGVQC